MNLRRLPLPVVFVVLATVAPAFVSTFLAVRTGSPPSGIWDHPRPVTYILLGVLGLGMGAFGTIREARERKRPAREPSRYQQALRTGHISGDVSGWTDRVRRQLRDNVVGWFGVAFCLWLGGTAVVNGPWWAAVFLVALATAEAYSLWRSRRGLKTLLTNLESVAD